LCFTLVVGPSCDDHLIGVVAPVGIGCTRDPPLTYDNFGKGILARHCNGCHSDFMRGAQRGDAPLDVNLNKWEYVLQWADRIEVRAVEQVDMPPTGTMVPLERDAGGVAAVRRPPPGRQGPHDDRRGFDMIKYFWLAAALTGCTGDIGIIDQKKVPPAPPPTGDPTTQGAPPVWSSCNQNWRGTYYNLRVTDAYVDPRPADDPAPTVPEDFPYWDHPSAFQNVDPSLDFGQNWWPVDQGLDGDPKYFAVHWDAWIKVNQSGDFTFLLASQDDSWVYVDSQLIASKPGIQPFVRDSYTVNLKAGQYPIDVWFIHRGSETSGFSFRPVSGDFAICYPDFGTGED